MHQPQVTRLATLLVAVLLVVPVVQAVPSLVVTTAFLVEFLTNGAWRPLSSLTAAPLRSSLPVPGAAVDRYTVAGPGDPPLVLVHGLAPEGKDDARLAHAARLLACAGFDVAVPTIPGLRHGRLRPDDVLPVVATLRAREGPTTVVGVSVGAAPALLAAADPAVRDRVRTVLTLGGYASARELLRFYLAGEYRYGSVRGHVVHDAETVRAFVDANADLLDDAARRNLAVGDPARFDRLLAALPPRVQALLDTLSPERVVPDLRARLLLVHGRADPAVPYTESLRLAAARPRNTTVTLLGVVQHVEGVQPRSVWREVHDLGALWTVTYSLLSSN